MRVNIKYVRSVGILDKERVVLEVVEHDDIGTYMMAQSRHLEDGAISNKIENIFWFPDRKVNTGDLVVLYTKKGRNNQKENKDGSNSHFFYWNIDSSIWDEPDAVPVLIKVYDWQQKRVTTSA